MVSNANPIDRYVYDQRTGRYRDTITGRFVTQLQIETVVSDRIQAGLDNLYAYLVSALDETTPFDMTDFQLAFADELRNLHIQMTVLGAGGRDNVTPSMWGSVGATLRGEYAYMNNFIEDIQSGNLTERQIRSRMNLYSEKITNSYWTSRTVQAENAGFTEMRRVLNPAEHCDDCIRLAGMGWQPIGTLPIPADGSTQCLSNCRCGVEYR